MGQNTVCETHFKPSALVLNAVSEVSSLTTAPFVLDGYHSLCAGNSTGYRSFRDYCS